jgi:hypothetical protein
MKDRRCVAFPLRFANISYIDFHVTDLLCVPLWRRSNNTHHILLEWCFKAYNERLQVIISINTGKSYYATPTTIRRMIRFFAYWKNKPVSALDGLSTKIHNALRIDWLIARLLHICYVLRNYNKPLNNLTKTAFKIWSVRITLRNQIWNSCRHLQPWNTGVFTHVFKVPPCNIMALQNNRNR